MLLCSLNSFYSNAALLSWVSQPYVTVFDDERGLTCQGLGRSEVGAGDVTAVLLSDLKLERLGSEPI